MTIDEIFVRFISDIKPLMKGVDQAENRIQKFSKDAMKAIGGVFAIGAITSFGKELIKTSDASGKFALSVGEDIEQVYKFEEITKRAGGSAEGFRSSIQSLAEKLTDARINGGESALIFQRIGVEVSDTTGRVRKGTDVLLSMNKQFQALSKTEQIGFGKKLGMDEGTIKLLQMAPKALDELLVRQEKLGVITEAQAQASAELNDLFKDFNQAVRVLGMMILEAFVPVIKVVMNVMIGIVNFIKKHKSFFVTFFVTLATVITVAVIPAFLVLAKVIILAFAPFIIIGAKIALIAGSIALIVDDIMNFMKGNNSVIGLMLDGLDVWFKKFMQFFVKVKSSIVNVFNTIKNSIKGFVQPIIDGMVGAFNGLKVQLANIVKPIQESLMPITRIFDGIGSLFGGSKLATQGASNSSTTNSLNVGNITINSSGDSKEVSAKIMDSVNIEFKNMVNRNAGSKKS